MPTFVNFEGWVDPWIFILLILLPIASALFCLYYALRFLKASWQLKNIPISKLRSAAQGYVELSGKADWLFPMTAELSGTPCVWYHCAIDIQKTMQTEEGIQKYWEPIEDNQSTLPFVLKDDHTECIILPEGAEILPMHVQIWTGSKRAPNQEKDRSFLNILADFFVEKYLYQYREYRIEKNDSLYVTGNFLTVQADNPLIQDQSHLQHYLKTMQRQSLNVITGKNLGEKNTFLISSQAEDKIIRKYQMNALMFFLAFLFFCMASATSLYPMVRNAFKNSYKNSQY